MLDGTELLWRVCDVALTYARHAKPGAPVSPILAPRDMLDMATRRPRRHHR